MILLAPFVIYRRLTLQHVARTSASLSFTGRKPAAHGIGANFDVRVNDCVDYVGH
jgi:hypothetical protein